MSITICFEKRDNIDDYLFFAPVARVRARKRTYTHFYIGDEGRKKVYPELAVAGYVDVCRHMLTYADVCRWSR